MGHKVYRLTEDLKDRLLHFDRLSPERRKYTAYDARQIYEALLEDLDWLITFMPEAFKRTRDRKAYYPLELIIPADPKRALETIRRLEEWQATLEMIKQHVENLGVGYMKRSRL